MKKKSNIKKNKSIRIIEHVSDEIRDDQNPNSEEYRCEKCSSENVSAYANFTYIHEIKGTCRCKCGKCKDDVAAERGIYVLGHCFLRGRVNSEGNPVWWEDKTDCIGDRENIRLEIFCSECFKESGSADWKYKHNENKTNLGGMSDFLICDDCEDGSEFPLNQTD